MKKYLHAVIVRFVRPYICYYLLSNKWKKLNICCGVTKIPEYCGIDIHYHTDIYLDLSRNKLPFRDNSMDVVVCMSAINYFTRKRALEIVKETFRVLRPGGVARFGVQDMRSLANKYLNNDVEFYFQKLQNGKDRFEGETIGDKFVSWFYGNKTAGGCNKYFYDYESLHVLFNSAGFSIIENLPYRHSRLSEISDIDNRPEQMFFLEAVK